MDTFIGSETSAEEAPSSYRCHFAASGESSGTSMISLHEARVRRGGGEFNKTYTHSISFPANL
jgi:hypothetical protein